MGAGASRQLPSGVADDGVCMLLTCLDSGEQATRTSARLVRDEEAAGSNPANPTEKYQVRADVCTRAPVLTLSSGARWRNSGEDLENLSVNRRPLTSSCRP